MNLSECITITRREYEYLKSFPELPEGYVKIREEELTGYKNALRIIHDRALQQIDKAKADQYGYRILDARNIYEEYGEYHPDLRRKDIEVGTWQIRMESPHSVNISYEDALFILEHDLNEFYGTVVNLDCECQYGLLRDIFGSRLGFVRVNNLHFREFVQGAVITILSNEYNSIESPERENIIIQVCNNFMTYDSISREESAELIKWAKGLGDKIIYKIVSLNPNYGTGRYEITFKCTKMI